MAALLLYLLLTWMFLFSLFRTRFAEVLCHADESSALMKFKRSFRTNTTDRRCVYPKVHSWSLDGSGYCCSWDGVKCDEVTGRVIALDLSSSCLSGTISPNTTLFQLIHVESLNLAYNSFDFSPIPYGFSPIPYGFSNLSRLKYLNLSASDFSGEIPRDISQLSGLVSLDLSASWIGTTLHLPNMGDLVHNLTGLKELNLYSVSLSFPIPPVLANFSFLTSLKLGYCRLSGDFPVSIFQLPNLEVLDIRGNSKLSGFFPKPHWGSPLKSFYLFDTHFSGEIPASIGNLSLLNELEASWCHFSGSLPSSMGNLSHLTTLVLEGNNLQGQIPVSFADLTQLSWLELRYCGLNGDFPVSIFQLPKLEVLNIDDNSNLSGFLPKPHWVSPLKSFDLSMTNFSGEIPASIGNLSLLNESFAHGCYFSGSLPSSLGNLSHLTTLDIYGNNLQGQILVAFADLTQLSVLVLSYNNLSGDTFEWMVNLTKLTVLEISGNSFFLSAGSVGSLFLSLQLHGTTDLSKLHRRSLAPSPTTTRTPAATATSKARNRDFLLHLKAYLAKRDATKIILSSSEFVGYIGSVNLKIRDLRRLRKDEACVESSIEVATSKGINCEEKDLKLRTFFFSFWLES